MSRECPNVPSGEGGGGRNRACLKVNLVHFTFFFLFFIYLFVYLQCNQEGHISRDCPNAPAGGGGNRACHRVSSGFGD